MKTLTENEAKIVNFITRNPTAWNSIRQVASKLKISAMGAQKILKRLEQSQIVKPETIGAGKYYKLNFNNKLTKKLTELVLSQSDLNTYAEMYAEDLKVLEPLAKACMLYGSILTKGEKARDVDIMVVLEKKNLEKVEKKVSELSKRRVKKIHLMMQTEKDLARNIKERNKAVLDLISNGAVLWGEYIILEVIENGAS